MNQTFEEKSNQQDEQGEGYIKPEQPYKKEPTVLAGLKLFLLVFILLLLIGSTAQAWHFEYGMIITQVFVVLLPAIIFWRRFNLNQASFSRLAPLKATYLPAIFLMAISFWIINLIFATGLVLYLMNLGFQPIVAIQPPATIQEYLGYIVVLSIFAGICEEVLFRGTIMPSMESRGLVPAIVFSSLLFALLHGSLLNLVNTFILGVVMAVIVIKTGSLWGGIIYHMLNNFFAATYLYIAGRYETAAVADVSLSELAGFLPLMLLGLGGAWLGLRLLHKRSGMASILASRQGWLPRGWLAWPLFIGLILYLGMAFLELAIGFSWINVGGL